MKLLTKVKQHIILNIKAYTIVLSAFFAGFLVAAFSVFRLNDAENSELVLYLDDFFENIITSGADAKTVFKISVLDNFKTVILALMFSLMIIGAPFVGIICVFYGYTSSFTLLFLLKNYGLKAIFFFLSAFLPHWLILVPAYFFFMATCLRFSIYASGYASGRKQGRNLAELFVLAAVVFALTMCASLIQAYVEPWLISFISKYYIQ